MEFSNLSGIRRYIDNVQISVAETVGVEKRGDYYDKAGALRDMVPNHIMQLITLSAMEPPISFDANAVRDEQAKILHAIQRFTSKTYSVRRFAGSMEKAWRTVSACPLTAQSLEFLTIQKPKPSLP